MCDLLNSELNLLFAPIPNDAVSHVLMQFAWPQINDGKGRNDCNMFLMAYIDRAMCTHRTAIML